MKYITKQVVKDAEQWTGDNLDTIFKFTGNLAVTYDAVNKILRIKTLEGDMKALVGDYIIKGLHGEFYPCKPDIFEKTYELYKGDPDDKTP